MSKNKKIIEEDDVEVPVTEESSDCINQNDLSEEELNDIRAYIEPNVEDTSSKKIVTGIRPNAAPKKSWHDRYEDNKKFQGGNTLVPKNWSGEKNQICKVCSPATEANTYFVKFYGVRDETIISGSNYIKAPEGTEYLPYMDEYTKWRYLKNLEKNKVP